VLTRRCRAARPSA